jgi:hypothetical protein
VRALQSSKAGDATLFTSAKEEIVAAREKLADLEAELDAAVFDLFELSDAERDLIKDMCSLGLPFFYEGTKSAAVRPLCVGPDWRTSGTRFSLPRLENRNWLEAYVGAFLEIWDRELAPHGRFRWRVIVPPGGCSMMAVVFCTEEKGRPVDCVSSDSDPWSELLSELGNASRHVMWSSRIYIDGMTRIVRENEIVIVKQNEHRLWTRSAAREDAEATLLQAASKQQPVDAGA